MAEDSCHRRKQVQNPSRDEPGSPAHSDALGWRKGAGIQYGALLRLRGIFTGQWKRQMTNQELEAQVKRLAQIQVETLQLIGSTTDRHDREMSELRQAQIVTEQSLAKLSDAQLKLADAQLMTQVGLDALIATVDRFIRGGGNGQH